MDNQTTERLPGDVLTFGDYGTVSIHFIENGEVYFSAAMRGHEDRPWLARMTFADFEASVARTAAWTEQNANGSALQPVISNKEWAAIQDGMEASAGVRSPEEIAEALRRMPARAHTVMALKCCGLADRKSINYPAIGASTGPCSRKATVERAGRHYCWQHDPVRILRALNRKRVANGYAPLPDDNWR